VNHKVKKLYSLKVEARGAANDKPSTQVQENEMPKVSQTVIELREPLLDI
jgi:hypothetical protein